MTSYGHQSPPQVRCPRAPGAGHVAPGPARRGRDGARPWGRLCAATHEDTLGDGKSAALQWSHLEMCCKTRVLHDIIVCIKVPCAPDVPTLPCILLNVPRALYALLVALRILIHRPFQERLALRRHRRSAYLERHAPQWPPPAGRTPSPTAMGRAAAPTAAATPPTAPPASCAHQARHTHELGILQQRPIRNRAAPSVNFDMWGATCTQPTET